ncbi:hypothetical protein ACER0A_014280 [Haloimpatiens sp. FM7315]|uniref:hypothetical protein n=1 Tax=Haloimpatiens sp. FM7315 TaxID=3298609 RepID=UPI00370B1CBB
MRKRYLICILIILVIGGRGVFKYKQHNIVKENLVLKNEIIQEMKKNKSVDFSKITNFDFEFMYVFTPYSVPEKVFNEDKVKCYNSNFNIELCDDINMIAFVKSNKFVEYVNIPRKYIDFNKSVKFKKGEAKLSIDNENK